MNKFIGKKLLVLGTNVASVDIVNYAKSEGAYVIVCDNLPESKSPAKLYANESREISTDDIDNLSNLVTIEGIDGVFSGVSEFNIRNAKKICDKNNMHSYFTWNQWESFMDKVKFRRLCQMYNVPAPKTYFSGNRDDYNAFSGKKTFGLPLIVKPSDCGANIGISICRDLRKLDDYVDIAFSESSNNCAIIEQFIEGIEVSMTYVVQSGNCKLVCMGSKFAYVNKNGLKALSHAYIYPSPAIGLYESNVDSKVKAMILGEGIDNCTIFFQGIFDGQEFYIFEAGLRMEGTASYRITEKVTGESFMKFMVDNALGISSDYDLNKENPHFNGKKCVIFSQIAREGTLTKVEGFEFVKSEPSIIAYEQRHVIGTHISEDGTLRQILFRYVLYSEDNSLIISTIKKIQNQVKAYDEYGNEMIIDERLDPLNIFM